MLLDNQKMAANIQFERWTADQVAEWLRGLDMDDAMIPYMHYFLNSGVDGKKLMLMTHADLEKLNVVKFGHQELILEAIDLLRNLRYGYETENLQSLALQLGCKARSLNGDVRARTGENDRNRANTTHSGDSHRRLSVGILSSVADLVATLKSLVAWMDKAPFSGFHDLCLVRNTIVKQGLDLINMCQREATIPDIEFNLTTTTKTLSDICEKIVIGSPESPLDPLYLQPASLEQATIRKKQGEELGMHIQSSYYGVHVISGIKDMSPADLCGKIEKGDEVIQVNHQIVAGWSLKKLVSLLKENPKEVILLLKKRPRHISPYGQMKRPNMMNKHTTDFSTLPKSIKKRRSQNGEAKQLRPSLQEFVSTVPSNEETEELDSPKETNDGNDTDNDVFRSGSESPQFTQFTLPVQPDPKQRRATVSGGSPTLSRPLLVIEDIDTPSRPKSFTIASTTGAMPHEIIINSPSGDNLSDLQKLTSAVEKRQDYKTKSTPPSLEYKSKTTTPSLEFSVLKPTPKIIEPKDTTEKMEDKVESKVEVQDTVKSDSVEDTVKTESVKIHETSVSEEVKANVKEATAAVEAVVDDVTSDSIYERTSQSPERLLDSSTDSVPPSESSMESSQTCTSSLESSSHSPPLEESSLSSERESSDVGISEGSVSHSLSYVLEAPQPQRAPLYVLEAPKPQRVPPHFEVASDFDKSQPQLTKIRKLDSVLIHNRDQEPVKKERHVEFVGVDSDKETEGNQSYICKVVGGVVQKIPVDSKGSPTHSPAVKRRPKTGRKKVDRRVSCKDLGKGDCEGWLYKRKAKGGGPLFSHWQKRWCVIKDYNMFCYHDKESLKAEVVIHLPAFKVSPVDSTDFKTKKHAFKIHNLGTSFYFASERQEDMSKWMNKMGLAAITFSEKFKKPEAGKYDKSHPDPDYSESDEEPHTQLSDLRDSLSSSTSSLHSIGRTTELRAPSPDLRASQEDLSVMIRKQSQRGQNLFGEDLNKQRRSALSKDIEERVSPEIIKFKKVKSLERTLKAKEKELEELETLLSGLSPAKLQVYRELHTNPGETDSE
ncbi:CNK3/IPCEF1 fusion protein-like isoform X1 [Mercenaria mercenaria]|uniref:CNK3/IPCEF1 fusion protein-like isoform X1 n=1 Tax=Mercenaria mercenaria TaxID=6596 RepID=UPI00234E3EF5|nr:CNK3/IPCEF1 fusion protein-like isoform X1 [Mercenaria mercenaria]